MDYKNLRAFAFATPSMGEMNQLLGAFKSIADLTAGNDDFDDCFVLPLDVAHYSEVKTHLFFHEYSDFKSYYSEVKKRLDVFMAKTDIVPRIFVTPYTQALNQKAAKNVDMLSKAVKIYYRTHNLGPVLTSVLTSRVHKYRFVDLINAPKHLMTFTSRIRLLHNNALREKTLVTIGIIHNLNRKVINEKCKALVKHLKQLSKKDEFKDWCDEFNHYIAKPKKVVMCFGGRVDGTEITFDINYAKKLLADAKRLIQNGFGVVIINGSRTPNEVTDFLYKKTQDVRDIVFLNCKKIAVDERDRAADRWRIYSGKYEKDFRIKEEIGNIYPAVLGFDNTLVMHTMDSYGCCETACSAIPTAISSKGLYIDPTIRYDCFNMKQLLCPKYTIDWDEFVTLACTMHIEPKNLNPQILSNPLRVFAETVVNQFRLLYIA